MPMRPSRPISAIAARVKTLPRSHSAANGLRRSAAKSRAVSRTIACSSERIMVPLLLALHSVESVPADTEPPPPPRPSPVEGEGEDAIAPRSPPPPLRGRVGVGGFGRIDDAEKSPRQRLAVIGEERAGILHRQPS